MAIEIKVMLGIILALSLILIYYEWILGILALMISCGMIYYNF